VDRAIPISPAIELTASDRSLSSASRTSAQVGFAMTFATAAICFPDTSSGSHLDASEITDALFGETHPSCSLN
jgi:hypothetical protein